MIRRIPVIPTILVVAALAVLIKLGIWQLQRAGANEALLASYKAAAGLPPVAYPTAPTRTDDLPVYRYATGNCLRVINRRTAAGENRAGESGFLIVLDCMTGAEGPGMSVEVGWSKNPNARTSWTGGLVSGIIVPDDLTRIRLASAAPAPGLEASAVPEPSVRVSPARNLGYAATWFGLAIAALVIYALAVRKRLKEDMHQT